MVYAIARPCSHATRSSPAISETAGRNGPDTSDFVQITETLVPARVAFIELLGSIDADCPYQRRLELK